MDDFLNIKDDPEKVDVVLLLDNAQNNSIPRPPDGIWDKTGEEIGEVPPHLRHVYNLMIELREYRDLAQKEYQERMEKNRTLDTEIDEEEISGLEKRSRAFNKLHCTIHNIFFDTLKIYLRPQNNPYVFRILSNWKVYEVTKETQGDTKDLMPILENGTG